LREIILHKVIVEITEIRHHNVTATMEVQIEIIRNNITGVVIIGHIHHNVTGTNNTQPGTNSIADKMDKIGKITIIEEIIGADHHVEECSLTAGRLEMTKVDLKHDKEIKEQLLIRDTPRINQTIVDVGHAPTKNHALRDSAGRPQ